jgi:hypothetical protein
LQKVLQGVKTETDIETEQSKKYAKVASNLEKAIFNYAIKERNTQKNH